ncbi:MAG TPA: hypothetical protein VM553_03000 [Dongiaceae bacterium]|nr:hypothetical protein [Dongiaceae bacterium]
MTLDYRHILLLVTFAGGVSATLLAPAFAQSLDYHRFADQRALGSIPQAADVLSNLAFVLAGIVGWWRIKAQCALPNPLSLWLKLYSLSLIATGCGSIIYHLAPDNMSLFWDRLPMTFTFSLFFCLVLASHIGYPIAQKILVPMIVMGTFSVLYWRMTELQGFGDLRIYATFQFLPLTLVVLMLFLFESRWLQKRWLVATVLAYLAAKLFELNDETIFQLTGTISGHTLKHLIAALGAWWVIRAALTNKVHPAHNLPSPRAPDLPPNAAGNSRTGA